VQGVEFVEINREKKNAIKKAVAPRQKALVHDMALVKAGVHSKDTDKAKDRMQGSGQFMANSPNCK
jgi:hypothetical protein